MKERLGFGFVGAGEIAVASAAGVAAGQHSRIARVYDVNAALAADLAARSGGTPAATLQALLADPQVQAVYICTPHFLHRSVAEQAAAAGKHVFIEKPAGVAPAETEAIIAACERAGVACGVPFVVRYAPAYRAARELVQSGAIGPITGFRLCYRGDKPASYWSGGYSGRATSDWRQQRATAGGGVLIMNIIHDLDALLWITGLDVAQVQGLALSSAASPGDVEDHALALLRCTNGALGSIEALASLPGGGGPDGRWVNRIYGRDGQILLPSPWGRDPLAIYTRAEGAWREQGASASADARQLAFDDFAAAVLAGAPVPVPGAAALRASQVVHAIYAAAEHGGEVAVPR